MNIQSIGLRAQNVDDMIIALKEGFPANAFDKLRDQLKVSASVLKRIKNTHKLDLKTLVIRSVAVIRMWCRRPD